MSFGEIFVIVVVAILVMKPEDLPVIIKRIQEVKTYFTRVKSEILSYLNLDNKNLANDVEQINFYLKKMANLNEHYEGNYSLPDIKDKYHQLIQQKIEKEKRHKPP